MGENHGLTLILGAGALGAMYARQIAGAGLAVAFLAEGERGERLAQEGIRVNGELVRVPVVNWQGAIPGAVDAPAAPPRPPVSAPARLIVALKDQHVPEVAPRLREICGANTTVLSVMNGIDSEYQLAEALGESFEPDTGRVLHCMVAGMDAVRDNGGVTYTRLGTIFLGRRRNVEDAPESRVKSMQAFFAAAEIPTRTPPDMEKAIWNKFMLNVGINQWSAVLRAPYGVFHRLESAQELMRRAMREVLEIARRRQIDLSEEDLENWFPVVNTLSAEGKTSMFQDIEAGRKTEVEMFAGRVVQLGRELGIATPVNEILLDAIHTMEGM